MRTRLIRLAHAQPRRQAMQVAALQSEPSIAACASSSPRSRTHSIAPMARALDILGKLRSVLLLHVTKEEQLLAPPSSRAVH